MIPSARSPSSLAWRLALVAVIVRLVYAALVQSVTMLGLPQSDQMRDLYSQPQYLVPMLTNIVASAVMVGLAAWGAMHGWLRRHDTTAVDEPRKLFGTFIALQLIYTLMISAAIAYLQNAGMQFIMAHQDALAERFGIEMARQFLTMGVLFRIVTTVLEIIGMFLIVRVAAWTVQRKGPVGAPAYDRRHAAWSTSLTVLAWQLSVSIALGGYLQMLFLQADWPSFVLGYLALPALLLVLCTLVCLKILPRQMGTARMGRAVAHGTIAFWLAQAMGIGIGCLVIQAMSWRQLMRAVESIGAGVATLAAYAALLALGCLIGKLALYRGARTT